MGGEDWENVGSILKKGRMCFQRDYNNRIFLYRPTYRMAVYRKGNN